MDRMKRLAIVWGALLFLIFGMLTAFGLVYQNKMKGYKDLERELVSAAKKYVEVDFSYPQDDAIKKISFDELKDKGLMESNQVKDKTCEAYATVKKDGIAYEYKGYIDCGKYKTKGFSK